MERLGKGSCWSYLATEVVCSSAASVAPCCRRWMLRLQTLAARNPTWRCRPRDSRGQSRNETNLWSPACLAEGALVLLGGCP